MRFLYITCRGGALGDVAARLLQRIESAPLFRRITLVTVSEDEMRTIAAGVRGCGPLPDALLEQSIGGDTSVVVQISRIAEIFDYLNALEAECRVTAVAAALMPVH